MVEDQPVKGRHAIVFCPSSASAWPENYPYYETMVPYCCTQSGRVQSRGGSTDSIDAQYLRGGVHNRFRHENVYRILEAEKDSHSKQNRRTHGNMKHRRPNSIHYKSDDMKNVGEKYDVIIELQEQTPEEFSGEESEDTEPILLLDSDSRPPPVGYSGPFCTWNAMTVLTVMAVVVLLAFFRGSPRTVAFLPRKCNHSLVPLAFRPFVFQKVTVGRNRMCKAWKILVCKVAMSIEKSLVTVASRLHVPNTTMVRRTGGQCCVRFLTPL